MTSIIEIWTEVARECEILRLGCPDSNFANFQRLWLPLATNLKNKRKPFVQGILAPQGTGKTTLTRILKTILNHWDIPVIVFSIDDLYKTYSQRQELRQRDPRLIWRGPPGTHDIDLGRQVITDFKRGEFPLSLPGFDKSLHSGQGDRIAPVEIQSADILLLEGWFVGMKPVQSNSFDSPPDPIVTPDDQQFARDCNDRLWDYLPLWECIDELLILHPLDYRFSLQWRKEAERKMRLQGKGGMSDSEIEEFVKYFWKALHPEIFIQPLLQEAHMVVEIKNDRTTGKIYAKDRDEPIV
ncbi:MAG: hypothetical protein N5P05_003080 [Chroococcopsis gigantea SAG 12.99]|jgi:D-glycerate 3-kinase|nr:ABC transporter ATP-binding protein [Chlorogloea purpurea SAG 13.99]MDV3001474.1 hypothetical protein [Chroococcopsis gigantea SAG 12.99]